LICFPPAGQVEVQLDGGALMLALQSILTKKKDKNN
jgi:hypothetical protein